MRHARHPTRRGRLDAPTHGAEGHNRPCGDVVALALVVADDRIIIVRFEGEGCALCMAAASVTCDAVEGATLEEARGIVHGLRVALASPGHAGPLVGDLGVLTAARDFPARHGCVLLAAETLARAIGP